MIHQNPICVALDTPDLGQASALAQALKADAGYFKIGMEFYYGHGARGYEAVAQAGVPVFLDLKLHDIPNTVSSALRVLMGLSPAPAILNVHAGGGLTMMQRAAEAVDGRAKLIAVTVLTSLADSDLKAIGFDPKHDPLQHAVCLARLAKTAGLNGVVCSAHEASAIRDATDAGFLRVVPGIRPALEAIQDQKRVATPLEAMRAGASLLVIGRPITGAADPAFAARRIRESLDAG